MIKRHSQDPRKLEDSAITDRSEPLEDALDIQAQARMAALEQENEQLRAELQAYQQTEAALRQREEQFSLNYSRGMQKKQERELETL